MDEYEVYARAYIARMCEGGWQPDQIAEADCGTLNDPWELTMRHNVVRVARRGSDRLYRARATDLLPMVPAQLSLF